MASKTRSTNKDAPKDGRSDVCDGESVTVSLKDLESVVEKIIKKHFEEYKSEMMAILDGHFQKLEDRIRDIEADLNLKTEQIIKLEESFVSFETKLENPVHTSALPLELEEVRAVANKATIIANDCEQYSRRNNLRIRGLKIAPETNVKEAVATWINSALHLPEVTADEIEAAHPLPKKKRSTGSIAGSTTTDSSGTATVLYSSVSTSVRLEIESFLLEKFLNKLNIP